MLNNLKRYTMEKRDRRKRTGEGGQSANFTETDEMVLDIIGENSPAVNGLPVNETWDSE